MRNNFAFLPLLFLSLLLGACAAKQKVTRLEKVDAAAVSTAAQTLNASLSAISVFADTNATAHANTLWPLLAQLPEPPVFSCVALRCSLTANSTDTTRAKQFVTQQPVSKCAVPLAIWVLVATNIIFLLFLAYAISKRC